MKATLTSKSRIAVPRSTRERLHRLPGDVLDLDDQAPTLLARKVGELAEWERGVDALRDRWNDGNGASDLSTNAYLGETRGA